MFPAMTADDMFYDLFPPIARDGAGMLEVQIALQEAFASLAQMHGGRMRAAATRHASRALARAETALTMPFERARLREAARLGPGGI